MRPPYPAGTARYRRSRMVLRETNPASQRRVIPASAVSAPNDGYLLESDPTRRMWVRHG
ncbi:hypothetical protein [Mycobacterium persicum]|nr:hypothetical protein [Mycobacterium persicum]